MTTEGEAMTEAEWQVSTDPLLMAGQFGFSKSARRKSMLFGCACCRHVWDHLHHQAMQNAVTVAEDFADGRATQDELRGAELAAVEIPAAAYLPGARAVIHLCRRGGSSVARSAAGAGYIRPSSEVLDARSAHFAGLLRDIFGNPFVPTAFDPEWRTSTAQLLAKQMYESRDFGVMPILADALQDAGCDSEDILNHCRQVNGVHVRGCWVVDLVLDKA